VRVTVKYHIPHPVDGGPEHRVTVIHGVPGRWDRPTFAIVDEVLIEDKNPGDPVFPETPGREWQDMITRAVRKNGSDTSYEDRLRKSGHLA